MPMVVVVEVLATLGVGSLAAYLGILGIKYTSSRRYAALNEVEEGHDAPITVLQPILSGDPYLEDTLKENLHGTPPSARFMWLIDEADPAAARVTGELIAGSKGRAKVLVCPPPEGDVNPKTSKLQIALAEVRTPYFAVLDDDTILGKGDLARAILALESCTLYTGLPCYLPGSNLWSSLVAHFVNNNSITTYLCLSRLVGPISINGMFYVMKTHTMIDIGGFTPIFKHLCDDYALARLVKSHDGLIRQAIAPQRLRTTIASPLHYFRVMHRWMVFSNVLAFDQSLGVVALLFVVLALPPWLLWLGLLSLLGGPVPGGWLVGTLVVRHMALRHMHRVILGGLPGFSAPMSVLAEFLQPLHWLFACLQTTLYWRTRHIRVARDGTFCSLIGGSR